MLFECAIVDTARPTLMPKLTLLSVLQASASALSNQLSPSSNIELFTAAEFAVLLCCGPVGLDVMLYC